MKIAIIGTGFVADYYMTTLANHPQLELCGVFDRDQARLAQFCAHYGTRAYPDFQSMLADDDVAIIVNLTTPESHYALSRQALAAGKHVYCEKPLAMRYEEAAELVALAEAAGLTLATAPANALSAAHRLVADKIGQGAVGQARLVYAQMEDGPVFRAPWQEWRSVSGARWPGLHEFEIGCTLEHAGYALSWLVALFGPVDSVTAFSALTFPDKGPGTGSIEPGPDFSVGALRFRSGVVARLTNGLAAPRDRSMTILGDAGTLTVGDLWDHSSPVYLESAHGGRSLATKLAERLEAKLGRFIHSKPLPGRKIRYGRDARRLRLPNYPSRIDFAGGIAAMADAIEAGTRCFASGDVALHITELALALNNAASLPQPYRLQSSFEPAKAG
ncbi:Gfo/Idh/MocA family oxidoreductase [Phyllobacterium sp. 21LDTY02-6]|uniref:Gfo/Idh/MocA family protein n=1 Tax=Phyllobacterium sp. 21LDTY02-6 TaxID=2944903 RepID=UPI0020223C7D|nr:Gfo/Idh/MocA family oxidoreductase [Phyllobacterium sp. 21LDTY02-6]MCO4318758.1 Gfo/Idh/MocA family oxidoreductase [Phyllobacterium sp. 21LDTY02-6]